MAMKKRKWIQGAVKRPGRLEELAKKEGVLKGGKIPCGWLAQKAKSDDKSLASAARLAMRMKGCWGQEL